MKSNDQANKVVSEPLVLEEDDIEDDEVGAEEEEDLEQQRQSDDENAPQEGVQEVDEVMGD